MGSLEKWAKYKLDMKIEIGDKTISINNKKSKLLQCIDKYGSIVEASKEAGISYRTALKNIEIMEIEFGSRIVVTKRGGKGGGGSSELTDVGKQILFKFIKINRVLKKHTDLNEIWGIVSAIDEENKTIKIVLGKNEVIFPLKNNFNRKDEVIVSISPNNIFIIPEPSKSRVKNMLEGIVTEIQLNNDMMHLNIDVDGNNIVVNTTRISGKFDLNPGKRIFVGFREGSVNIIKI